MPIPVLDFFVRKTFGTHNQRMVRRYLRIVDKVNDLEAKCAAMTDPELMAMTPVFRKRIADGERPYDMIPEIFAVAREAMDRGVGIRNAFNPALGFDPNELPEAARAAYLETKAVMDATSPREPVGELLGCRGPIEAWQFVDIPVSVYAAVRELLPQSKPPFRARPFDVQLIGGIVLSEGRIAEMKTGEGKTIVAPLACYLAACDNKQVHVVTVNDYLVQRDRDWTFPFHRALGLRVGCIHPMHMQPHADKVNAYLCDVVYGTTSEFGFDYLRDNMKLRAQDQVQKRRDYAIVDEVDSTLIDEARTPLIISGPAHNRQPRYELADRLARHLVGRQREWQAGDDRFQQCRAAIAGAEGDIRNAREKSAVPAIKQRLEEARRKLPSLERERDKFTQYFELEMDKKRATLTHDGIEESQKEAKIGSFYVGENMDLPHLLEQSVRAHTVYQRDRDYVIAPDDDGQMGVVIVDQNTGRKMVGRQWSDGLHQAVEAKEAVRIKEETQTMATITIQNFYKLYKRLAGMTGTADTEATEFFEIYRLTVVSIPTNVATIRVDQQDLVFISQKDKWERIVEEIARIHDSGAPVLVGTTSVEKSEMLSRLLTEKSGIRHEVLNAKQHEREAEIIAGAGQLGAVMIATNMAGRGTDIKLVRTSATDLIEHWKRRNLAPKAADAALGEEKCMAMVHRHLATRFLGTDRAALDSMDDASVRRALLEHWVSDASGIAEKKVKGLSNLQIEAELDRAGWSVHRLRFIQSTEDLGGLHVVGTERHESRRIDNQLRGRSGRQGDSGHSRFYLALDDDLMKMFAGRTTLNVLSTMGMKEGDALEAPMLSRAVERAQRKVEERNFQIRKTILEYDEPMEVQRRAFYGRRQPILEGKGIKEVVLGYIDDAVADAAHTYLSPGHVPGCISQWVFEAFGVMVEADRFKGKDREQILKTISTDTVEEASAQINITIGEYLPEDGDESDWDRNGVIAWAQSSYGATVTPEIIDSEGRTGVIRRIEAAAQARFEAIDLFPVEPYLEPGYGAKDLLNWAGGMLGRPLDPATLDGVREIADATATLQTAVRAAYRQREIHYPIDFAIEFTNANIQTYPQAALTQFCGWARGRYELEWQPNALPATDPAELRRLLVQEASRWDAPRIADRISRLLTSLRTEVAEASPAPSDPKAALASALEEWLLRTLFLRPAADERTLLRDDPEAYLNQRFPRVMREELEQFERFVLLQILDQSWKDHLHTMDQTRDSISFRSFSQKDPRIEFKKESSRNFAEMLSRVSERVTDLVFKGKLSPQPMRPPPGATPPVTTTSTQAIAAGLEAPASPTDSSVAPLATPIAAQIPATEQDLDIAIAERAGAPQGVAAAAVAAGAAAMSQLRTPSVPEGTRLAVGRNEPCPCGSGKKFKACCGKK
ncbi:MAG: preprotein translocase subunit SecA [Phycisphaerales bacterium]|nr:preprotein translocase subunit SecA [Phycisphaerales bacterium]